ncbi:UNVERIFIED_CONTAM: hypothetical protein FKN15_010410 [Acipenser sinensis]
MDLSMLKLLLLLVPAIFLDPVNGYGNGKVTESCRSMKPGHGHPSQSLPSPYTVTVDKSKFSTGDQIKVALSGSSTTFKGFLIQARDMADPSGDAIGSFTLVDHYVSQLLNCGEIKGNDDVYLCVRADDYVNINPGYVTGRTHPTLDSQDTLTNVAWRLSDGVVQCMFRREIRVPAEQGRFNLDRSYYIFLADGKAEHDQPEGNHLNPTYPYYRVRQIDYAEYML